MVDYSDSVESPRIAPPIYVGNLDAAPVDLVGRLFAGILAAGALATLIVAAWLVPSAAGLGTHEQLALRPCEWITRYDTPCPACGMTTSFAWFVRGRLDRAAWVQPGGTLLAMASVLAVWIGGYIALTARPIHRLLRFGRGRYVGLVVGGFFVLAWGWTIARHRWWP